MKKRLLFSSALLAAMSAGAQTWEASAVAEGDFYLYNVGAGQFAQGGNSWGTQISLHQGGQLVSLVANGEGYNIDSHISNGGDSHFFGGGEYLDGAASAYTFEALADGAYAIKAANGNYMYAEAGNSLVKHSAGADLTSPYAQWKLLSVDALKADMANASLANPIDVTPLIFCAGFGRNNTYIDRWNGGPARGGNNENMCAEKWNTNFDINQVLEGMPAGNYKLMVQGFYRAGNPADLNEETAAILNAILYVNATEQPLRSIQSEIGNPAMVGNSYDAGTMPNSINQASSCFTNGLYENTLKFKLAEEGDITIGIKKDETIGNDWSIFDNFRLIYTGVPDFGAVSALVEQAKGLTAPHAADLDEELGIAIQYAETVVNSEDEDNMEKAVEELQAAMDKVNASIAQYEAVKAAIDAAKATAAGFDAAGKAAFDKLIAWCEADYEAGEVNFNVESGNDIYTAIHEALATGAAAQTTKGADMTALIANADFNTGNLSGWDVVNAQWQNNNTYGAINRFAEKWVAGGNTLGDCSLTQTVKLGMGVYVLEADVVATQQGGMPEGGIVGMNLVAGDASVACSTGNGEATHYALEFTAPYTENYVELGFKVEGTNGNWWAVDNFKLTLKHIIIPEPEMAEMYFEGYDAMDNGICTYAKDMGTNGTTYSQMQPITSEGMPTAWEIVENGDAKAAGIFAYGSEAWLGAKGFTAPAEGTVEGSEHALGMSPVWSASIQYTRPYALAKGCYKIKTAVYNAANGNNGGENVAANKIGYITEDGTEFFMATKSFPKGEWTEDEVWVRVADEYSVGKLSVGVSSPNSGTNGCVHLFVDYLTVEPMSLLEFIYEEVMAISETLEEDIEAIAAKEGDQPFMFPVGSADKVQEAYMALCNVCYNTENPADEDIEAAYDALKAALNPAVNKPVAGEFYVIKNVNADKFLSVASAVTIEDAPSLFNLVETEAGWQLKSGDHYVGMAGTNDWSMSNDKADSWTVAYVGDGKYTLKGAKGYIGTDKIDAGSACYGNKGVASNGEWTLALASETVVYAKGGVVGSGNDVAPSIFEGAIATVECYADNHLVVRGWDGTNGSDLTVYYTTLAQGDETMTVITGIEQTVNGEVVSEFVEDDDDPESAYVTLFPQSAEYPSAALLVRSEYNMIGVNAEDGYLVLHGMFQPAAEMGGEGDMMGVAEPVEGMYIITWNEQASKWVAIRGDIAQVEKAIETYEATKAGMMWASRYEGEELTAAVDAARAWVEEQTETYKAKYANGALTEEDGVKGEAQEQVATVYEAINSAALYDMNAYMTAITNSWLGDDDEIEGYYPALAERMAEMDEEKAAELMVYVEQINGIMEELMVAANGYTAYNPETHAVFVEGYAAYCQALSDLQAAEAMELDIAYSADNSSCVVKATTKNEGVQLVISIDGGEEWMELPEEGYTIAWLESKADESGICIYNVVVAEVSFDEEYNMTFGNKLSEQVHLSKPLAIGGGSAEEPIILADGWNEPIDAKTIGADEAGYTHFKYTAEEDGTFVFSCGYEIKAIEGLEEVESASVRNAYGKEVEAGDVVEFSAYLPQSYEGVAYDENGEEIEGETVLYGIDEYTFYAGVDAAATVPEALQLAAEMFKVWDNFNAEAVETEQPAYGEYHIGEEVAAGGAVYGDGGVFGNKFADLSAYHYLALTVKAGAPRLLFNRQSMDDKSSDFLEINNNKSEYVTVLDGVWFIDLAKIVEDKGYAHLNVIKATWGGPVTITKAELVSDIYGPYIAEGETVTDDEWGTAHLVDGKLTVQAYKNYVVIKNFDGAEGYDLQVNFDEDENVTDVFVRNGKESVDATADWAYSGNAYWFAYKSEGYSYAYSDMDGGYVLLSAYVGSDYVYYYVTWEAGELNFEADGIHTTVKVLQSGAIYDLAGRRVSQPQKGQVYIVNGKKVKF